MSKTVLITGASSGIGKATAQKLLDEGYTEWGSIAIDKLIKTSGHTAYAKAAQAGAKLLALANDAKVASEPEVIANTISKALKSKQPKARYPAGTGAKLLVAVRKFASDAVMDRFMQFMIGQAASRQ